jgi:hypothetical protein
MACKKYGKRLVLTPINEREQRVWDDCHRFLGFKWGMLVFRFWHRWFLNAPEIIADPLALCITCFASVYGTLMWIFWYQVSKEFNQAYPTEVITAFLALSLKLKIALWIVFCMSLAYINELLVKLKS